LSELNFALQGVKLDNPGPFMQYFVDHDEETERYLLAKSYFDLKEYDRYVQLYTGRQMPSFKFKTGSITGMQLPS